jgi:hypothetical protein
VNVCPAAHMGIVRNTYNNHVHVYVCMYVYACVFVCACVYELAIKSHELVDPAIEIEAQPVVQVS